MDDQDVPEEAGMSNTTTITVALVAVVLSLGFLICRRFSKSKKGIPGLKPRNARDGNMADIKEAGSVHQFLLTLHKRYGPIACFWWGQSRVVSIHKPEHFQQTVKMFDKPPELMELFESLFGKDCIACQNGAEGQARFKDYARCFSDVAIIPFYPELNQIAKENVDDLVGTPPELHLSVIDNMFAIAIKSILRFAFGKIFGPEHNNKIKRVKKGYEYVWGDMEKRMGDNYPEAESERERTFNFHLASLKGIVKEALDWRRAHPGEEGEKLFVDVLLEEHQEKENVMLDDAITMFVGGFHTTSQLLIWSLYYIADHADVQDTLRQEVLKIAPGDQQVTPADLKEMPYLKQVLDETLRCSVLAPYANRVAREDMTIGAYDIPKGTIIFQSLGVASWDEERWTDARRFDPERFSPENRRNIPSCGFEPFGFAGKRKCPAYRLSYAEASVFLVHLMRRTRIRLAPDQQVEYKHGLVTSPLNEIWFLLDPL